MTGIEPEFIQGNNEFPAIQTPEAIQTVSLDVLKYELTRKFDIDFMEGAANAIGVKSQDDASQALSMALQARKLQKALEESRLEIVKPHFDYQKAINKLVKDFTRKLDEIESNLKSKIDGWMIEQQENPFAAIDKLEVEDGTITLKKTYDFVVEDEREIPREYLQVDAGLIEKAVKFGIRKIPGVKIIERTETALRVKN